MRSVLTMALGVALVSTCVVATGCANRRAMSRSSRIAPASNMRLARRARIRSTTPRRAMVTARHATDAYAPRLAAPEWIEIPSATTTHTDFLDPCGIAGNEHMWIDVTPQTAAFTHAVAPTTTGVWMPADYQPPAAATCLGGNCALPDGCATGACCVPLVGGAECVGGNCGVPGACPNGQCDLPE